MKKLTVSFVLNGEKVFRQVSSNLRLVDFLRDDLNMISVKEGCGEGECGACTIILNGNAVTSCTMLAAQVDGCDVITLEGLSKDGEIDKIQQSFIAKGAVQCGFCTPGMILSAKALLMKNANPSKDEIRTAISGNLCRCTGYQKIIEAIEGVR